MQITDFETLQPGTTLRAHAPWDTGTREPTPYELLANAIVLQAVEDYREAVKILARGRRNTAAAETRAECLEFFRSGWFELLTVLNPEALIRKLNEEVDA